MYIPDIELHECESIEQAGRLLARYGAGARILAGGTDLLVDLKTDRTRTHHLISLQRLAALRGVALESGGGRQDEGLAQRATSDHLRIGALTTINGLHASPLVRRHVPPLRDATREMATVQVRNLATIGGNIASAVPCADLPPILMALGASVVLWSAAGTRTVFLDAFFVGPRKTVLQPEEVLIEVRVPTIRPRFGAAYVRFALRDGNAIAVASVAAGLMLTEGDRITAACVVLGAVAPTPLVAKPAAEVLVGETACDEIIERAAAVAKRCARPISDVRGSADYRRELVEVLTRRALAAAAQRAREDCP